MRRRKPRPGPGTLAYYDAAAHPPSGKVWGMTLCGPCNNSVHIDCMFGTCECLCHTAVPRKARPKADTLEQPRLPECGSFKVG